MRGKKLLKCTKLLPLLILILSLCGQTVYAQEFIGKNSQQQANTELPMSAMRVNMYTNVDDQTDINGYNDIEVIVTWVESLEMKEPVTITVSEETKILVEDIGDIKFESNGVVKEISNLSIQENSVKFMTGLAEKRSNCKLTYKVRTPIAAGEFKIYTKIAADDAPTTQSNSVERAFYVTAGLTVETTYDTIYGDTPFDVFGLVNYKIGEMDTDLLISLDIYNEDTGEFVYELTGADFPKDNTYKIGPMSFPDDCKDGTYIVYVTLMDGMDVIGSASKKITYAKTEEFKITVWDKIRGDHEGDQENEIKYSREFVYKHNQRIDTIQPKEIEDAAVVDVTISQNGSNQLMADDNYHITGIMPAGDVEIIYTHELNNVAKGFVNGLVTNQLNAPIENAAVKAYHSLGGEGGLGDYLFTIMTDSQGKFYYTLKEGVYNFAIIKDGYIPLEIFNIEVKAEETVYLEKSLIVADIDGHGNITGLVYDAFTGSTIPDVVITFRSGWNNKAGTPVAPVSGISQTNSSGEYNVVMPYGNYTAEFVKEGYVTGYVNVICALDFNAKQNATITPVLAEDEYRAVLTWGITPRDLDSHLTGPTNGNTRFHVYYLNKSYTQSDGSVIKLDVDNTSSYGPETITFKLNPEAHGVYRYSIYDFTNAGSVSSQALSLSGAQVKVYNGDRLIATFNIPTNQSGTVWRVFDVDQGIFKPVNTISNNTNEINIEGAAMK